MLEAARSAAMLHASKQESATPPLSEEMPMQQQSSFQQQQLKKSVLSSSRKANTVSLKDDDDDAGGESYGDISPPPPLAAFEEMEHTLLDDSGEYFPSLLLQQQQNSLAVAAAGTEDTDVGERRVPGEPMIPSGFVRFRLDVQYQGHDFEGWHKTHLRRGHERGENKSDGDDDILLSKPLARRVVEDALGVALDLSRVEVVSSVLPESGIHVRRLPCHVDLPAETVMQPRTILQRASIWL